MIMGIWYDYEYCTIMNMIMSSNESPSFIGQNEKPGYIGLSEINAHS